MYDICWFGVWRTSASYCGSTTLFDLAINYLAHKPCCTPISNLQYWTSSHTLSVCTSRNSSDSTSRNWYLVLVLDHTVYSVQCAYHSETSKSFHQFISVNKSTQDYEGDYVVCHMGSTPMHFFRFDSRRLQVLFVHFGNEESPRFWTDRISETSGSL